MYFFSKFVGGDYYYTFLRRTEDNI